GIGSLPPVRRLARAQEGYAVIPQRDGHVLRLHVEVEAVVAAVAAYAAGLHATERRRQVADVVRVDPDHAGVELAREAVGPRHVVRPQVGGEAVVDVVGDPQGLGFAIEGERHEYRPEDLLPGDAHAGQRAAEQRGAQVLPVASAAGQQPGAFAPAALEVVADLGAVLGVDERADLGGLVERVADPDALRPLRQGGDE